MVFVFNPFHIEQKSKNTMLGCVGDEPLLMQGALKWLAVSEATVVVYELQASMGARSRRLFGVYSDPGIEKAKSRMLVARDLFCWLFLLITYFADFLVLVAPSATEPLSWGRGCCIPHAILQKDSISGQVCQRSQREKRKTMKGQKRKLRSWSHRNWPLCAEIFWRQRLVTNQAGHQWLAAEGSPPRCLFAAKEQKSRCCGTSFHCSSLFVLTA